jgi:NADPH:quinone reductase
MLAVWVTKFGGPEVLVARETPDPVPAEGQVVVDVTAASITFVETRVRAGSGPFPAGAPEPPFVPGNGVGGIVSAVGANVEPGWIGQRIVTTTGGSGGYAEKVAVPVRGLVGVPAEVDLLDATALLADGRTASGLIELSAPRPGEWVLVEAAAGGVGTLLVQLALAAGANVIGVAGGERKCDVVRSLGATLVVDYGRPEWVSEVRAATERVDVVFDSVGGAIGAGALTLLRPGGRFVQFGVAGGAATDTAGTDLTLLGFRELGVIAARSAELTASALAKAAAGTLRPIIGQMFPLAKASDAHAAIESRATIGKTLLIA